MGHLRASIWKKGQLAVITGISKGSSNIDDYIGCIIKGITNLFVLDGKKSGTALGFEYPVRPLTSGESITLTVE